MIAGGLARFPSSGPAVPPATHPPPSLPPPTHPANPPYLPLGLYLLHPPTSPDKPSWLKLAPHPAPQGEKEKPRWVGLGGVGGTRVREWWAAGGSGGVGGWVGLVELSGGVVGYLGLFSASNLHSSNNLKRK